MEITMKENRQAAVPFVLVTVFLDMMGIAIVIPVLPGLIATFTADRDAQTYWYGAMLAAVCVRTDFGCAKRSLRPSPSSAGIDLRTRIYLSADRGIAFSLADASGTADRGRRGRQLFGRH
jgi:hypothetical protein